MAGYGLRAFLIAQSLNQIDKAYGPNHSILDNCHIRIAFATNDERTAKRISEALGTGTELRAQRNYAGHRLAPWLGHLMVSRQETARPLLTPGEVMQLPPDDEVVMVSGHPPIKARKLQYYRDRNFMQRVMAPPVLGVGIYADRPAARPDDWSGLAPVAAPHGTAANDASGFGDDGGHQRKPELDLVSEPMPEPDAGDLLVLDDGCDDDAPLLRSIAEPLDQRLLRNARLAALDPDDGISL
jgi:type IV secretion system protein VirD4